MAQCGVSVPRLYKTVIEEVMSGVKDFFLDEGIDEQVLNDLKQQWEAKIAATKATEHSELNPSQLQQHPVSHQQVVQTAVAPVTLVPVQITVPSQQAGGTPKSITIHVPSSALSSGIAGQQLQAILGSPAAAQTFALEASQAAEIIQRQLNTALLQHGVPVPQRLLQFQGSTSQVDGPSEDPIEELSGSLFTVSKTIPPHNVILEIPELSSVEDAPSSPEIISDSSKSPEHSSLEDLLSSVKTKPDLSKTPEFSSEDLSNLDLENSEAVGKYLLAHPATFPRSARRTTILMDKPVKRHFRNLEQIQQIDGATGLGDSSDEMSDDDDDEEEEETKEEEKKEVEEEEDDEDYDKAPEDPLNSEDDVSDEGGDLFDTENVVVCQYDRITRVRTKWKFYLKDGIMQLKGKDFVFTKANGEGEW